MIQNISWHQINEHDFLKQELTPERALSALILCELAFGAQIHDLSPTKVRLQTEVAESCEFTIFYGPANDMSDLVDVTSWYIRVTGRCKPELQELLDPLPPLGDKWPQFLAATPLDKQLEAGLKLALIAWLGAEPTPELMLHRPKDLMDAHLWRCWNDAPTAPLIEVLV